jgi:hypothetical protein
MDEAINAIRAALVPDATAEARTTGVAACRAILGVLEPEPVAPPPLVTPELAQQVVAAVRTMNPDQLLEVAIAKLRTLDAAKPSTAKSAPISLKPLSIPMVPVTRPVKKG